MADIKHDRRTILTAGLGVVGAVAAVAPAVAQVSARPGAPAISRNLPDVIIAGAGAFGGWAALELRERGAKVTLVDLYGPGNPRSASGGESRNIRASYGDREIYTRWATDSWKLWHSRQEEFGRRLIYPNGSLRVLAPEALEAQKPIFTRLGLPFEQLTSAETNRRWPQYRFNEDETIFWEKESGSVKARETLIAISEVFMQKGGQYVTGRAAPGPMANGRMDTLLVDGAPMAAGTVVFACGPWLGKVFPELLGAEITVPRGEMWWIGSPPGDERYRWENVPNITDRILYTSADNGGGYKIAARGPRVLVDPDTQDRAPTESLRKGVLDYVAMRLPGLVGQPVVQTHVCQTENTTNGHFIIDTHPDASNVWLAGGGSGHGFKMGPKLGEYVADCVVGKPQPAFEASFFTLAAHATAGRRTQPAAAM